MCLRGQIWAGFLEAEDFRLNVEEPHKSYAGHEEVSGRAAAQGCNSRQQGKAVRLSGGGQISAEIGPL